MAALTGARGWRGSQPTATLAVPTASIEVGGSAVTATVKAPASRARLSFSLTKSATVVVTFVAWTFPADGAASAYLASRTGARIRPLRPLDGSGPWSARPVSLQAGRYFIVIDVGRSGDSGSVSVQLTPVGAIASNGTAVSASIKATGQPRLLMFTAKAGTTVVAGAAGVKFGAGRGATLGVEDGDGIAQGPVRFAGGPSTSVSVLATLAKTGTYYVAFRPAVAGSTGSAKLTLRVVRPHVTAVVGGPAVSARTGVPGIPALVGFTAKAKESVAVVVRSTTFSGDAARIYAALANGSPIGPEQYLAGAKTAVGPVALPSAGRYTVVIDPGLDSKAGRVSFSLIKIADVHLRTTIGGRAVTAVIGKPTQRAFITFRAKAKQQVLVKFSGSTFASPADTIALDGPHGTRIDAPVPLNAKSGTLPAVKLASSGTYTVLVDPSFTGDRGRVTVAVRRTTTAGVVGAVNAVGAVGPVDGVGAREAPTASRPASAPAPASGPIFKISYHFAETDFFFTGGFDQGFLNTSSVSADWNQAPSGVVTGSATEVGTGHTWLYHDVCIIARLSDTFSLGEFSGALLSGEAFISAASNGSASYQIIPDTMVTHGFQITSNLEYDTPICTSGESVVLSPFDTRVLIGNISGSILAGQTSASGHSSCGSGVTITHNIGTLVSIVRCSLDWSVTAPPDITCQSVNITLPVTNGPVTVPFKPVQITYGALPLTFTSQPTNAGSLCTIKSNAGALPVYVGFRGSSNKVQVASSITRATLDFFPADDPSTFVPPCDFAGLRGLGSPDTTPPPTDFTRITNCLITSSSHASGDVIARWSIPGFSQYEPNEHGIRVYTTPALTLYVDLAALPNPPGSAASFQDVVQAVETYVHHTLVNNLPTIDKFGLFQDPPAHLLITDPLGRTVGRRGTGKTVTFPGAGYAEFGGRSIAWIVEPVPGLYHITASGRRGARFRSDFTIVQFLGHGTAPLLRNTPVHGTLGAGGVTKSTFHIRGDALAPVLKARESRTRVKRGRPVRFSLAGSVIPFARAKITWSFGDKTTAKGMTVTHRFRHAGRFVPVVTVTSALGATVTMKLAPIVVTR